MEIAETKQIPFFRMGTGTPATLRDSIHNGLAEGYNETLVLTGEFGIHPSQKLLIENHVRDYLAQKFGRAILDAESPDQEKALLSLYEKVTGFSFPQNQMAKNLKDAA